MKIENNDPLNVHTGATDSLLPIPAAGASGTAKAAAPSAQPDQLTLSPEAQLLKAAAGAARAAASDPAVRADLVARMRALLEQGGVGDDAPRLADALIDDVLNIT